MLVEDKLALKVIKLTYLGQFIWPSGSIGEAELVSDATDYFFTACLFRGLHRECLILRRQCTHIHLNIFTVSNKIVEHICLTTKIRGKSLNVRKKGEQTIFINIGISPRNLYNLVD